MCAKLLILKSPGKVKKSSGNTSPQLAELVKNAEEVFLATDPDREGEAIAWHLQEALKLKNAKCVTCTKIAETDKGSA